MKARPLVVVAASVTGLVAFGVISLALLVDDWSRDLTTNVAETSAGSADPLLRPIATPASIEAIGAALRRAVGSLARWSFVGDDRTDTGRVVRLVHTTRLLRFRDDITVWIDDQGERRVIRARSASRVGRADLGQNPRNLRELLGALRDQLAREGGGAAAP